MSMSPRVSVMCGAVLAGIAVACGAFGAHALKDLLERSGQAANWETGCRYAMYHAVALVVAGILGLVRPSAIPWTTIASWSFLAGIVIFSGSLLALALSGLRALGAVVPVGGLALIAGWLCLALAASRADA